MVIKLMGVNKMHQLLNKIKYYDEKFPKEELEEIIRNKEQSIPILLDIMKDVCDNYEKYLNPDIMIHMYATHLLAQFKIKEFYEIIIDIAKLPGEIPYELYEDTITESLGRIIASVYNGDIEMICDLIEDTKVDKFVRSQGIVALQILVFEGILRREKIVEYLKKLLVQKIEEYDDIIEGIINGLTNLYPEEAMDEIKLAYQKNIVDEMMISLDDVRWILDMGKEAAIEYRKSNIHSKLMGHINDEMGHWYCFNKNNREKEIAKVKKLKIGRNDSCICGSGKKYKKCCGKNI